MMYEFYAHTDCGLRRTNNEDAVVFDAIAKFAILADGMGGYNAGEVASSMAITLIQAELSAWLLAEDHRANTRAVRYTLENSVAKANQAIIDAAQANPDYAGMGTTLVVGVFLDKRLVLGHVGDSRCYRLRGEEFKQITRDHSWVQEQIDAGLIAPHQIAQAAIYRNLVTRALGVESLVSLEVGEYQVQPQDLYLMCSDGLSDMIGNDDIARILLTESTLQQKATQLIDAANTQGGRDNISVLLTKALV